MSSGFPKIEVSGMSFAQSIEAPVTVKDTVTMSGNLSTHNGTGKCHLRFSFVSGCMTIVLNFIETVF